MTPPFDVNVRVVGVAVVGVPGAGGGTTTVTVGTGTVTVTVDGTGSGAAPVVELADVAEGMGTAGGVLGLDSTGAAPLDRVARPRATMNTTPNAATATGAARRGLPVGTGSVAAAPSTATG